MTVKLDGVDKTGQKITLTESGSHTLKYTWRDPYNYGAAAVAYAPIFTAVEITDYADGGLGDATVYNSKTESKPSNFGKESGNPYINGAATTATEPCVYENYGLCWKSNKGSDISEQKNQVCYKYTDNAGKTSYYYICYLYEAHKCPSCIPSGTMITLADGSKKAVERLGDDDRVLAFNHETGCFESAGIAFLENDGVKDYTVVNLGFSDRTQTRLIYEHGYFDLDLMKYVYIREGNFDEYIGHRFFKEDGTSAVLEKAWVSRERVGCYSFPSEYHLNFVADGFLSMPGGISGMFNIFEYNEDLSFNKEKMEADIEKYGLFEYSDFEKYMSREEWSKYPAAYLKVALGKGLITYGEVESLLERYVK